jgi:lysophospholipid acyltransferase (LPLAT)-like uncharacterized protein
MSDEAAPRRADGGIDRGRKQAFRTEALSLLLYSVARLIGLTLRVRFEGFERIAELQAMGKGLILVTWHGRSLIAANVLRNRGYWALISLSRDGDMQNRIFQRFGYRTVRGSTSRGGVRATLQLARSIRDGGVLAFTPDGPKGPTHKVQPGTIFLAHRSGCPILPVGIAARPRTLVKSWDRYMVPGLFARATFVVGEPISVPEDADDEAKAAIAEELELAMNHMERRAEEMLGLTYPAEFRLTAGG